MNYILQNNLQGPQLCASTYSGTVHRPQSAQDRQKFDKKSPARYASIQSNENPRSEHKLPAVCWMTPVLDTYFGCQFAKCWMSSVFECWGEKPQGMPEIVLNKWNGTANISNKIKTTLTDLLKYIKLWSICKVSVQPKFHIKMAWRWNTRSRRWHWTAFSASQSLHPCWRGGWVPREPVWMLRNLHLLHGQWCTHTSTYACNTDTAHKPISCWHLLTSHTPLSKQKNPMVRVLPEKTVILLSKTNLQTNMSSCLSGEKGAVT